MIVEKYCYADGCSSAYLGNAFKGLGFHMLLVPAPDALSDLTLSPQYGAVSIGMAKKPKENDPRLSDI
jgi:hypothetical protein